VEEQLTAGLGERQVAEPSGPCFTRNSPPGCFVRASPDRSASVDDHEVDTAELIAEPAGASGAEFGVEAVHEVDGAEEADAAAAVNGVHADRDGQMRLARAC